MYRTDSFVCNCFLVGCGQTGDAEVHYFECTVTQKHYIVRFEVSVDNAIVMSMTDGRKNSTCK